MHVATNYMKRSLKLLIQTNTKESWNTFDNAFRRNLGEPIMEVLKKAMWNPIWFGNATGNIMDSHYVISQDRENPEGVPEGLLPKEGISEPHYERFNLTLNDELKDSLTVVALTMNDEEVYIPLKSDIPEDAGQDSCHYHRVCDTLNSCNPGKIEYRRFYYSR